MVFSPTAVVSIEVRTGKKWVGLPLRSVEGTQAQLDSLIARLHLTPLPDPALVAAKAAKLAALQSAYDASLEAGFAATGGTPPITAKISATLDAQGRLSALLSLWSDYESHIWDDAYAATPGDSTVKTASAQAATVQFNSAPAVGVVDYHGSPIVGSIGQMRRLIVAFGMVCAGHQFTLQAALATVKNATTVADVEAVH